MKKLISDDLIQTLRKDTAEIKSFFQQEGYKFQDIPEDLNALKDEGEAYAIAYPIQGILKYHGFYGDPRDRIAYFPSISFNNDSLYTLTYIKLDSHYQDDRVILNGTEIKGEGLERVKKALDMIRTYSKVKNKALVISRNLITANKKIAKGKGLGTSASASAALTSALMSIIYNNHPKYLKNFRLRSFFSRFLSGSGCRSATGGISLWLSHPHVKPFDCFSFRLDNQNHKELTNKTALLTIPIESDLKTNLAHKIAPQSLFFKTWLRNRKSLVYKLYNGLKSPDIESIGQLAEYDTHCLHAVTMTGEIDNNLLAWDPKTLKIMHTIRKLRNEGIKAYYSIDTGPSVIILLPNNEKDMIKKRLSTFIDPSKILEGKIGGQAKVLSSKSNKIEPLTQDINKFTH